MNSYRKQAIETLKKIFRNKSYSNIVINNDMKNIDYRFLSLYRKSVLGVIENLVFIDWIINQVSKTKTKKMEIDVLTVLRLAVYQLFFLDKSHENIVVNESVQYVKNLGNIRGSKFVNAVLRNILRNKDKLITKMNSLPYKEYLSVKYSYPKELISRWEKQFGDDIEEVLIANNKEAPLNIRVNTLKIQRDELIEILEEKGIKAIKCKYAHKGLIVENPFEIEKNQEYINGLFSIQSQSSMLAGQILNPKDNSFIIDMCAAPGGKTLNAAELMNNTGKILARDIYPAKLKLLEKELKRLNINNVEVEEYDGTKLDESLMGKADYVIVDVPCTGLGIIRRRPEIKYNPVEKALGEITEMQYRILSNGSKYLKPSGELVYSTCSVNKEENIEIIRRFLRENKDFTLVDFSFNIDKDFNTAKDGYIEIYPHVHGMDGFFIAKIKRL
jgi:16S rRNA (cytosine967-C5)-methyltransferase